VTNYVAVVGPKTVWPGSQTTKLDEIPDGTYNTIMLVETANSGIHWMEPRDLSFEQARRGINRESAPGISSHHMISHGYFYHEEKAGANVATADGAIYWLPPNVAPTTLESLLTIDGGEPARIDELYFRVWEAKRRLNWTNCVAVAVLLLSVLLLLLRPRRKPAEPGVES
jgi:hypothetical protein